MSDTLPNGITILNVMSSSPNNNIIYYRASNTNGEICCLKKFDCSLLNPNDINKRISFLRKIPQLFYFQNYQQSFVKDNFFYVLTSEQLPTMSEDGGEDNCVRLPLTSSQGQEMLQVLCQIFFQLHIHQIPHPIISLENLGITCYSDSRQEFKTISLQDFLFEKEILSKQIDFDDQHLTQNLNKRKIGISTQDGDMFNLGALMFQMLQGEFFQNVSDIQEANISDDWKNLLSRMLNKDLTKRIQWNEIYNHRVLVNLLDQSQLLDRIRMRVKFEQRDIDLFYQNKIIPNFDNDLNMGITQIGFKEYDLKFYSSQVEEQSGLMPDSDRRTTSSTFYNNTDRSVLGQPQHTMQGTGRRSNESFFNMQDQEEASVIQNKIIEMQQLFVFEIEAQQNKYIFLKEILNLLWKPDNVFAGLSKCGDPILIKGLASLALSLNYRLLKDLHRKNYTNFDADFLTTFRASQKAKNLTEILSEDSEILETHYVAAQYDAKEYFTCQQQPYLDYIQAYQKADLGLQFILQASDQAQNQYLQSQINKSFDSTLLEIFNKKQSAIEIQIYDTRYFQDIYRLRMSSKMDLTPRQINCILGMMISQFNILNAQKKKKNPIIEKKEYKQLVGCLELLIKELTLTDGRYPFFETTYQDHQDALHYTNYFKSLGK